MLNIGLNFFLSVVNKNIYDLDLIYYSLFSRCISSAFILKAIRGNVTAIKPAHKSDCKTLW